MKFKHLVFTLLTFFVLTALSTLSISAQSAAVYNYQVLGQTVNDLTYSSKRRLIYASVPSTGGMFGNFVIAINPFSKQIVNSVFVGSEPNKLAISSDEQFLYVGLDGSASVRKIILNTMTADITIGLGTGSFGLHFPEDIAVLPNHPNSVAVSRRNTCCSPRHEGVAIFDNGVMRTTTTPGHTGSNSIEQGENENVLYGYNNETTDFGFRRMVINSLGVSVNTNLQNVIQGFNVDIRYSKGRIYSTTGIAINTANNSLDGTFAVQGFTNGVMPDAKSNRVFFIQSNTLKAFNSTNFQPTGTVTLDNSSGSLSSLLRWGRRGLAYRTADNRIALFETSLVPAQPNISDFNGDEIADLAIFRPSTGTFWYQSITNTALNATQWGVSTDIPVVADYDGDNKTDFAVFRNGTWYILRSSNQSVSIIQFGLNIDKPVSADYDGDQKADIAVYRNGVWYVLRSSAQAFSNFQFGIATDTPVPADYDNDGKADWAVYRADEGNWYILNSASSSFRVFRYGISSAKPSPADYDGDGIADVSVWQNVFGSPVYYVLQSKDGQSKEFVLNGDSNGKPVPADYDGDGIADPAIFNPNGTWIRRNSSTNSQVFNNFGLASDITTNP